MSRPSRRLSSARRARAASADRPGRREQVLSALERVPAEDRLALTLRLLEGMTVAETATALNWTPRAVQSACERLMLELRRAASGIFGANPAADAGDLPAALRRAV
jgi:DNA-directed RNA polymerase specialized sigma24 family protein